MSVRLVLNDARLKMSLFQGTDVLYMKLLSKGMIVLNSSEAIDDLMEKRSNIYSDRVSRLIKPLTRSE